MLHYLFELPFTFLLKGTMILPDPKSWNKIRAAFTPVTASLLIMFSSDSKINGITHSTDFRTHRWILSSLFDNTINVDIIFDYILLDK